MKVGIGVEIGVGEDRVGVGRVRVGIDKMEPKEPRIG